MEQCLGDSGKSFLELKRLLGRHRHEQVDHAGDDAGPACLMAGAVVAVKILVEQDEKLKPRLAPQFR